MPRLNGFEMLGEMGRDADKHRRRATELGTCGYIIKPFSREDLVARAHEALAVKA